MTGVTIAVASRVQVEDFADDLPLAVGFEESEHVGEAVAGPVGDLDAGGGDGSFDVDIGDVISRPGAGPLDSCHA